MRMKITPKVLGTMLAAETGHSPEKCEEFVRELFGYCLFCVEEGQDIRVRGIGSFRVVDVEERKSVDVSTGEDIVIPRHKKLSFIPCDKLAKAVNADFDMFEPVPIADDVFLDDVAEVDEVIVADAMAEESTEETGVVEEEDRETLLFDEKEPTPIVEEHPIEEDDGSLGEMEIPVKVEEDHIGEIIERDGEVSDSRRWRKSRFVPGMLAGIVIGLLLGLGGYFIFADIHRREMEKNVSHSQLHLVKRDANYYDSMARVTRMRDSIKEAAEENAPRRMNEDKIAGTPAQETGVTGEEVATRPSDGSADDAVSVEDMITTTRYLTTMAREHYGNDAFWPYIYEENKAFLRHPDRIRPGTKVMVPPLSKYGVNPRNVSDIRKAKKMGVEIYSRYKK